ncbi:sensor histidine kinase [Streptosporangium subroseum]|uniref:sensor histidine kinase n=1 Tax=Streptosporangium subroseum TaxID=106412 RepID=UPI003086B5B7|nr:histidine kinase [Streptosporangium subroseum]
MRWSRVTALLRAAVPWTLGTMVFLLSWASAEGFVGTRASVGTPVVLVVAALSGVAAGLAPRRRWPLFAMAAVGWALLAMWPASLLASYHAAVLVRRRAHLAGYLAGALAVMGVGILIALDIGGVRAMSTATPVNAVITALLLIGLPLTAGLWLDARRLAFTALRDRAERLEREQEARTEQVRAQERARIAREMHDVVAHKISLLVLHAGALEVSTPDDTTRETATLLRSIGREALVNLREVLGVLRSPYHAADAMLAPQPVLEDLDRLLDQSRTAGVPVTRHDEGDVRALPSTVERTAYRVVQEALTNIHKHAGNAAAQVTLRYLGDHLKVTVSNDPPERRADALPGSGTGLAGLRERVQLLGGTLEARPRPDGGFEVHARIPVAPVGALA